MKTEYVAGQIPKTATLLKSPPRRGNARGAFSRKRALVKQGRAQEQGRDESEKTVESGKHSGTGLTTYNQYEVGGTNGEQYVNEC